MRPGFRGCRSTNGFLCLIRVDILSILIGGFYYEIITTTDRPTAIIRVYMMMLRSSRPTVGGGGGASRPTTQGAIPFLTDLVHVV